MKKTLELVKELKKVLLCTCMMSVSITLTLGVHQRRFYGASIAKDNNNTRNYSTRHVDQHNKQNRYASIVHSVIFLFRLPLFYITNKNN